MSGRARGLIVLAVFAVAAAAALLRLGPVARLANYDSDGPGPIYAATVDDAALRRAGRIVPSGTTYAVIVPPAQAQLARDVQAGAFLYLLPDLPLKDPRRARWILAYGTGRALPAGMRAARTYRLADRVFLSEVARR